MQSGTSENDATMTRDDATIFLASCLKRLETIRLSVSNDAMTREAPDYAQEKKEFESRSYADETYRSFTHADGGQAGTSRVIASFEPFWAAKLDRLASGWRQARVIPGGRHPWPPTNVRPGLQSAVLPSENRLAMTAKPFFVRFGHPLYMRQLVEEGRVLLRDLAYYSKSEDPWRRDPNEGALAHHDSRRPGSRAFIKAGDTRIFLTEARIFGPEQEHGVYCMTRLETEGPLVENQWASLCVEAAILRHTEHESFADGTACVAILNPARFVQRFCVAAWRAGLVVSGGAVNYYSEYPIRPLLPCDKRASFSWEKEYRLVTTTPIKAPLELKLGPLLDVAQYIEIPRRRAAA